MQYEIHLPFPPTVNNYYGKTKQGIVYIKPQGKKFRAEVEQAIIEQLPGEFIDWPMMVEAVIHMPDKRRRDLCNYEKALSDAVSCRSKDGWHGLWEDDSLIDQYFFYRGEVVSGGMVVLYINEAGPTLKVGQRPPD